MTESTPRNPDVPPPQPPSHQASILSTPRATGGNLPRATSATRAVEAQKPQSDTTSDKATAAFIRRTLCTHNVLLGNGEKGRTTPRPIEEVLPPLTSSNEVDLQLYGIISVIIKEFVQTWYSKITPDHVFVNEVIQVIAHCTRALEQRLRKVDLEALLLDEIPELLEAHLSSFRLAKQQATSPNSLVSDHRLVYHMLHPHPALSPVPTDLVPSTFVEQRESESAWRQLLVQGVLAVLLPTEDLENGCLRSLVAEIFAEMILGNGIGGKACEGWLLWEGITRIAEVLQTDGSKEKDSQSEHVSPEGSLTRLERFGLLPSPIDEQARPLKPLMASEQRHRTTPTSISGLFWAVIQYAFLACTAVRAVILNLVTSSALPSRYVISEQSPIEAPTQSQLPQADAPSSRRPSGMKRPLVSMKLWSCASRLAELDIRMPWLLGFISMLHRGALVGPGRVGETDGVLDR
ncbi:Nn.00g025410.m01.CDS01 [Neocucurbitaria sp. VM-36]